MGRRGLVAGPGKKTPNQPLPLVNMIAVEQKLQNRARLLHGLLMLETIPETDLEALLQRINLNVAESPEAEPTVA